MLATRHRIKWIVAAVALLALIVGGAYVLWVSRPLERQVLSAQHIEFIGEAIAADGGSHAFFFRLSYGRPMALLVRHRLAGFGANPEFQEIWLDRSNAFITHIEIQPGSELERKLVGLLRTATPKTSAAETFMTPPRPERLAWVIERIQDRKTKW